MDITLNSAGQLGLVPSTVALRPRSGRHRADRTLRTGARRLELLFDRHGADLYALARVVTGDDATAAEAVRLAMADLASSTDASTPDLRRVAARHVYLRSQQLLGDASGTAHLPAPMGWLERMAPLQRASLALCCWGAHTHRQAAEVLGVPSATVAELLIAGLREFGGTAVPDTATCA